MQAAAVAVAGHVLRAVQDAPEELGCAASDEECRVRRPSQTSAGICVVCEGYLRYSVGLAHVDVHDTLFYVGSLWSREGHEPPVSVLQCWHPSPDP